MCSSLIQFILNHLFIQFYQLTIKFWIALYGTHFYEGNSPIKVEVVEFLSRTIINKRIMQKLDKHCVYCSHFKSVEIKPFMMIMASFIQIERVLNCAGFFASRFVWITCWRSWCQFFIPSFFYLFHFFYFSFGWVKNVFIQVISGVRFICVAPKHFWQR